MERMSDTLKPMYIHEMSVAECEQAQVAMLYPWEWDAWEKRELSMSDTDLRHQLMDVLDIRILEVDAGLDVLTGMPEKE